MTRQQARTGIAVAPDGTTGLTLVCPAGGRRCALTATLTATHEALYGTRTSAGNGAVVLGRAKTVVPAGKMRGVAMHLPAALVQSLQARGITLLPAMLSVRTALPNGSTLLRVRHVRLHILAPASTPVTG